MKWRTWLDNSSFIKSFGRFHDDYKNSTGFPFDHQRLRKIYSDLHPVIPILHWGMLPILLKWLMINSGRLPENGIIDFYDHYDMLTALLNEIRGRGEKMETKGDDTLYKKMTFSVYTRRWGHPDVYRKERNKKNRLNTNSLIIQEKLSSNHRGLFFYSQ